MICQKQHLKVTVLAVIAPFQLSAQLLFSQGLLASPCCPPLALTLYALRYDLLVEPSKCPPDPAQARSKSKGDAAGQISFFSLRVYNKQHLDWNRSANAVFRRSFGAPSQRPPLEAFCHRGDVAPLLVCSLRWYRRNCIFAAATFADCSSTCLLQVSYNGRRFRRR